MQNQPQQRDIKNICKMLFEMATGNVTFRIEADSDYIEINEIAGLLNTAAEKLQFLTSQFKDLNSQNNYKNTAISTKQLDATTIQNVYEYIINNLEEPLPSSKKLSNMFGTNEFKLKNGFRNFFHTSIYQFYNDERLKKASQLIQTTDLPLKEIAFLCGFNSYLNFYKAFRKKYLISPSNVNRQNNFE